MLNLYVPTKLNTCQRGLRPHLHLVLTEANHSQGFPHYLPVTAIVDGAHFGTVSLWKEEKHVNDLKHFKHAAYLQSVLAFHPLY